ncbi:MAG: ABC transporter ATP-binding protein/permease [Rickettsiales bacterium]|jgi:ATP-binding cassette subfamily B protein|nr:ABC transporter ATP-binding protein/permease [Rickettsiales bacterium]
MLPKSLFGFYVSVFAEKRWGISAYYVLYIFYKITGYILPAFLVKFLVGALESKPLAELTLGDVRPVLIGITAWILLYILSDIISSYVEYRVYPETKKCSHVKVYQYLIDKSVAFYKNHSAGYLESQAKFIISGTWRLMFVYPTLSIAILFSVIANMGILFDLNWIFAVVIGGVLGMRVFWGMTRANELSESYVASSRAASEISGKNIDILSNFLNLKIFGNARTEQKYVGNYYNGWVRAKMNSLKLQLKFFALPMTTEFLSLIFMIVLMTNFYFAGRMDLSEIAFVLTAFFSVRSCVLAFVWEVPEFLDIWFSADQAYKNITRHAPELGCVCTGPRTCKYKSVINFRNVSFRYDSDWVLRDINLCVRRGEKIGVVGASGSGKTTLVNLLMHLYDVTGGAIEIDGTDIRKFTAKSLKSEIAFVPQDSILFNRTLAENISYGVANATTAKIHNAARQAAAHDFIMKMDSGYETVVGDRGVKLSGGQRQRITIAHALLKNAPILLLDEATSALDSETEANIQRALDKLMRGRTTIAIAHRLSTLKQMDRIIVMDCGRIIEDGTHAQLLKQRGKYYQLWQLQSSGFM